jgi:F0F1-type ATP synthase gamma subunit
MVIGNTGIDYMEDRKIDKNYATMHFSSDDPGSVDIMNFLEKVETYSKVDIFYPRFVNVFQQEPGVRDIAYAPEPLEEGENEEGSRYISEPELSKMLDFFDTQVKSILFQRTILETKLSRAAARVVKMDKAEDRAEDLMQNKSKELQKQIAQLQGRRLLETFSGYKKWKENK